jgi:hypothetical protein
MREKVELTAMRTKQTTVKAAQGLAGCTWGRGRGGWRWREKGVIRGRRLPGNGTWMRKRRT